MSDPQLNPDPESKSFLRRFWANGGVFSIIALCFFLLSFAYSVFLGLGVIFLVLSLIWTARYQREMVARRRALWTDSESHRSSD